MFPNFCLVTPYPRRGEAGGAGEEEVESGARIFCGGATVANCRCHSEVDRRGEEMPTRDEIRCEIEIDRMPAQSCYDLCERD
jgi:hypothetical protein